MSGATDSGMVKMMGLVMGALVVLALLAGIAARMLGVTGDNSDDPIMRNALMQRIQPVGNVRTSADDLPAASAVMEVAAGPKTAEELVNGACAACHVAGVAGAPMLGDEAAWAERRELGLEALVASVINGKGSMPARGGSTYTDEEITRAVQSIALFDVEEAAVEEAPAAADDSAQSTATEAATAVAAVAWGEMPDGLTDTIKATVDGVCAGCHIAGVANAPKYGDKEAWAPRLEKGMAALVASVVNGLNVMPPGGGSTLTEEEIPVAIQYMLAK